MKDTSLGLYSSGRPAKITGSTSGRESAASSTATGATRLRSNGSVKADLETTRETASGPHPRRISTPVRANTQLRKRSVTRLSSREVGSQTTATGELSGVSRATTSSPAMAEGAP